MKFKAAENNALLKYVSGVRFEKMGMTCNVYEIVSVVGSKSDVIKIKNKVILTNDCKINAIEHDGEVHYVVDVNDIMGSVSDV